MTLQQMHYFATVCQFKNISTAAQELYISQPALSAAITELETETGFQLLDRKSRGVYPTEEGLLLLQHITSILNRYTLMEQDLPLIAQTQNTLKIGFRPYTGENKFYQMYKAFKLKHPELVLKVYEMSNDTPAVYLEDGLVDFLLISDTHLPDDFKKRFEYVSLGPEPMHLFANINCPIPSIGHLSFEDFSHFPLVLWKGHKFFRGHLEELLAHQNLKLNVAAVFPQITGVLQYLYHNVALGFLPSSYAQYIPELKEIPLPTDPEGQYALTHPQNILFCWKKETERYQAKKYLVDYMKENSILFREGGQDFDFTTNALF